MGATYKLKHAIKHVIITYLILCLIMPNVVLYAIADNECDKIVNDAKEYFIEQLGFHILLLISNSIIMLNGG